jgi:hypothetical protein
MADVNDIFDSRIQFLKIRGIQKRFRDLLSGLTDWKDKGPTNNKSTPDSDGLHEWARSKRGK